MKIIFIGLLIMLISIESNAQHFSAALDISSNVVNLAAPYERSSTASFKSYLKPGYTGGLEIKYKFSDKVPIFFSSEILFGKNLVGSSLLDEGHTFKFNEKDYYLDVPLNIGVTFFKHLDLSAGVSYFYLIDYKNNYTVPNHLASSPEYINVYIDKKSNNAGGNYNNYTFLYINPNHSFYADFHIGYLIKIKNKFNLEPYFRFEYLLTDWRDIDYLIIGPFHARTDRFNIGFKISKNKS